MKKIAYIIPGYGESSIHQRSYGKIAKYFESVDITTIQVSINWRKHTLERFDDYVEDFLKQYKKEKNTQVYVLGFSFGAMIAFLTAIKTKPDALILCSPSPYFEEDLKIMKPSWLKWWRKNFTKSDYSFTKLAEKIGTKTYLLVGEKEDEICIHRAKDAKKKIKNSMLTIIKSGQHKIGQKEYLEALRKVINKI